MCGRGRASLEGRGIRLDFLCTSDDWSSELGKFMLPPPLIRVVLCRREMAQSVLSEQDGSGCLPGVQSPLYD